MKFAIPEISWHNRDPVLSVDFQPLKNRANEPMRLASGGTDTHVLIWYIKTENGTVDLEVAADLARHQKAVNVVRWSPNGELLASGDDESIVFVWKQKTEEVHTAANDGEEQYKESWIIHKTLRGHMEDVLDLCWSGDSLHLASGSVDNKLIVWDVSRGKYSSILTDHKGFVQGVAWDPKGQFIASASTDRVFRTFDVTSKKVISRSSKASLPFPSDHPFHGVKLRLYHDDTLQTYYRRLQFSPDGMLVAVPAGKLEPEQGRMDVKPINAVYIYTRFSLKVPVCTLPCGEPALAVRWCPLTFSPRSSGPNSSFPLPRRMVLAVATKTSVMMYDTQQKTPIALISNIHYTRLTDLTWSPNGSTVVASSTDGYCSVIMFTAGELGEVVHDAAEPTDEPMDVQMETEDVAATAESSKKAALIEKKQEKTNSTPKIDSYIKFKTPSEKSPKKQKITNKRDKTPIKIDLLEETAMQSWSDNSNNEIIKLKQTEAETEAAIMVIDDSEDIQLVYDESQDQGLEDTTKAVDEKQKTPDNDPKKISPIRRSPRKNVSPNSNCSPVSSKESSNFLKQAKVTDIKDAVAVKTVQSPKAPRRVSFVTLSSPKNSKKK